MGGSLLATLATFVLFAGTAAFRVALSCRIGTGE
jgi:hypothetical protein